MVLPIPASEPESPVLLKSICHRGEGHDLLLKILLITISKARTSFYEINYLHVPIQKHNILLRFVLVEYARISFPLVGGYPFAQGYASHGSICSALRLVFSPYLYPFTSVLTLPAPYRSVHRNLHFLDKLEIYTPGI